MLRAPFFWRHCVGAATSPSPGERVRVRGFSQNLMTLTPALSRGEREWWVFPEVALACYFGSAT
jgi:hypothetical protein